MNSTFKAASRDRYTSHFTVPWSLLPLLAREWLVGTEEPWVDLSHSEKSSSQTERRVSDCNRRTGTPSHAVLICLVWPAPHPNNKVRVVSRVWPTQLRPSPDFSDWWPFFGIHLWLYQTLSQLKIRRRPLSFFSSRIVFCRIKRCLWGQFCKFLQHFSLWRSGIRPNVCRAKQGFGYQFNRATSIQSQYAEGNPNSNIFKSLHLCMCKKLKKLSGYFLITDVIKNSAQN